MTFGVGDGGRISDRQQMREILDHYKQFGDELDTARMYCDGNTEEVLAELKVQETFKLATKAFPFKAGMHSKILLRKQFEESLAALKSNHVDIFYLHAPDHATPFEETLEAVNELYKEGKFTELGLSNYASWSVMQIWYICKTNGYVLPTVYQGRYSVISRDVEPELFPCLRKLGIRFYAYNPLNGGLLAGKFTIDTIPSEGRFQLDTVQGARYRQRFWNETYFNAIEKYKKACSAHNISTVEAAHRWIMNHSKLDGSKGDAVIIGASSLEHVRQNISDCHKGPLPDSILAELEECWKIVMPVAPSYGR
ncbi:hypothetical protein HDV02_000208 [Globomyces sp. JEL0801]|nr:hypothetical protein HDV02_000208 [Globomyces sp. JEL0801]